MAMERSWRGNGTSDEYGVVGSSISLHGIQQQVKPELKRYRSRSTILVKFQRNPT
jgi:hypothetical protein